MVAEGCGDPMDKVAGDEVVRKRLVERDTIVFGSTVVNGKILWQCSSLQIVSLILHAAWKLQRCGRSLASASISQFEFSHTYMNAF